MLREPEAALISAEADELFGGLDAEEHAFGAGGDELRVRQRRRQWLRQLFLPRGDQIGERHVARGFADVVDERDLLLPQIEEAPGVGIVAAAREAIGDDDRVREGLVLRLQLCLDGDDRGADARLVLRWRGRRGTTSQCGQEENQSFASYQLRPHRVSTAS